MRQGTLKHGDRYTRPPGTALADFAGTPFAVAIYAAGVLWPLAWLVFNGFGAAAVYEESLGYRYFYTLRQLHEGSTYLFLPQGQSTNLLFKLVHVTLDLAGIPPTELRPRIDQFYLGAIALMQAINVAAFVFLLRQAPPRSSAILIAAFWLLPFYAPGAFAGHILLSPDYVAVEPAIAMLAAGAMAKAYRSQERTLAGALWLGVFLGAAIATKITLIVFPGVVVLFLVLSTRPLGRSIRNAAVTGLAGLAVWMLVAWADQSFGFGRLSRQLYDLQGFVRSGGGGVGPAQDPWLLWLWARAALSPLLPALIYLTPVLALGALAFARDRRQLALVASLLAGAAAYTFVQYQRDYPVTFVEFGFYAFMAAWCAWCALVEPRPAARSGEIPSQPLVPRAAVAAALVLFAVVRTYGFAASNLSSIAKAVEIEQRLVQVTEPVKGRRLWLVPDNDGRPMSVEAAIMKGGSGPAGIWLDPDSALMRHTVPDLDFRFERNDRRPVKVEEYAAILFMTRTDVETRLRQLNRRYHIDLFRLDCRKVTAMATGAVVMCTPKREAVQS